MLEMKHRQFVSGEWRYWGYIDGGPYVNPTYIDGKMVATYEYTYLKDKNKNEIYLGDILKIEDSILFITPEMKDWLRMGAFDDPAYFGQIEIIGNCVEHPQLLIQVQNIGKSE